MSTDPVSSAVPSLWDRLSPRQRQYAFLIVLLFGGVGLLWLVFALTETTPTLGGAPEVSGPVTNIDVMAPGSQVSPLDRWVGNAGRKLAQYESDRQEQSRLNQTRQDFEQSVQQRLAELEQRLTGSPPLTPAPLPLDLPPLEPPPGMPVGSPPLPAPPRPAIAHIRLASVEGARPRTPASAAPTNASTEAPNTLASFLPVSFTRGTLLGGLDAPTGGQAQGNPHPVLIRLADSSVLPNRYRGDYRECFVIAAGYGDISAERAYLRTENLSCVRPDGRTLEVKIQGSVYGEDGKVGVRGRLVTKQGQLLANALMTGVISGLGRGIAAASTEYATTPLGTVSSVSGSNVYRAGIGTGIGQALDRLAQYYIQLAEKTFPVIEIDAGREIDVVITKGARIEVAAASPEGSRDDWD
ncbi:TraB/VirB10 family protein [Pseudomonas sp. 18175]|uniref:TraB/VirB10 family protein n=1 Tax=Pseudomonas sp. 18175 TaxID=3390056 RepID=UPI003D1CA62E